MTPSKGFLMGIAAVIVVGLLATTFLYRVYADLPNPEWDQIKEKIRKDFPGVPETTTAQLAEAMDRGTPPLVIDSREKGEFDVSHLPGALHVTTVDGVKELAAPDVEIVVYCSVGYRSGKLVAALRKAGFTRAKNLEGSIFAWANEDRPLVRDGGEKATTVHPFSKRWGALLDAEKRHPSG